MTTQFRANNLEIDDLSLGGELEGLSQRLSETSEALFLKLPPPVIWAELWDRESKVGQFLVPRLVPKGRNVAIVAKAKQGKSLLALDFAASVALGTSILGIEGNELPTSVMYLDMEMTQDDLRERMVSFGHKNADLSSFHYFSLPELAPLDTSEGAQQLGRMVSFYRPELIVIDTLGRVVQGDENSADTVRAFYRHSGALLKSKGITTVRLDHEGKDSSSGARGSSAKGDDIDLAWRLTNIRGKITLTRQLSRLNWVPSSVSIEVVAGASCASHRIVDDSASRVVNEIVGLLNQAGAEIDISITGAQRILAGLDRTRRKSDVAAAVRARKEASTS